MNLKIIGAVAALAVAMPFSMATPSAAQGQHGWGGGGMRASPGGGHFGGARGFGGARSFGGGGNFRAAPAFRAGSGFTGARHFGGRPGGMRPIASGGWRGGHGWRGHGWHGHRHGGFYPGFAAGALIGSAFAAPYAYGYGYPYYDDDYYYAAPAVTVAVDPGSVAYCQRRFKSYDVRTGTYLGYDGLRHPCP